MALEARQTAADFETATKGGAGAKQQPPPPRQDAPDGPRQSRPREDTTAAVPPPPPRESAAPRAPAAHSHAPPDTSLRLQPEFVPRDDGRYHVSEILGFHDRPFVDAAFAAVLRRAPSAAERQQTLADLRAGRRGKIEIVRDLARSDEGARQSARGRIAGLKDSPLAEWARRLPVVGPVWRALVTIARLPVLVRHQQQFEAYALAQQQQMADYINEQRRSAADQLGDELRLALADVSAAVSMLSDALAEISVRHDERQSLLALRLDQNDLRLDQSTLRHEESERRLAHSEHRLDEAERQLGEGELRRDAAERRLDDHSRRLDVYGQLLDGQRLMADEHSRRLDAQQEFLIREQQDIVEAQKAALAGSEERLRQIVSEQRRELALLSERLGGLRAAVEAAREAVGEEV